MAQKLDAWFGKHCKAKREGEEYEVLLFDFSNLPDSAQFLNDAFGDCKVPRDYVDWLGGSSPDDIQWKNKKQIPFAFVLVSGVHQPGTLEMPDGMSIPPETRELWVTDPKTDGPVFAIEFSAGASPAEHGKQVAAKRSTITFEELT